MPVPSTTSTTTLAPSPPGSGPWLAVPVLAGRPGGQVLHDVAAAGRVVVAVGADQGRPLVLRSEDAGTSWTTAAVASPAHDRVATMLAVTVLPDGSFLAVGGSLAPCVSPQPDCRMASAVVWHSVDAGHSWSLLDATNPEEPSFWLEAVQATEDGWIAVGTRWTGEAGTTRGALVVGNGRGWYLAHTLESADPATPATTAIGIVSGPAGLVALGEVLSCLAWERAPDGEVRPATGTGRALHTWALDATEAPRPLGRATHLPGAEATCGTELGRQADLLAADQGLLAVRVGEDVYAVATVDPVWRAQHLRVGVFEAATVAGDTVVTVNPQTPWTVTRQVAGASMVHSGSVDPSPAGWPVLRAAAVVDDRVVVVGRLDTGRPGDSDVLILVGGPDVEAPPRPDPSAGPPGTVEPLRLDLRHRTIELAGPVDLTGADLTGATLRVAGSVTGVTLRGALLDGTTITGSYADPGPHRLAADLGEATVRGLSVFHLDLTGTTTAGARIEGPVFVSAVDSRCPDGSVPLANTCMLAT